MRQTTIFLSAPLDAELVRRIEHSRDSGPTIRSCLERYFLLLAEARGALAPRFSNPERMAILDALNGTRIEVPSLLPAEIAAAIALDGLAEKWKVDGEALVDKLKSLTSAEAVAVIDAAEVWWNRVAHGEKPGVEKMF